MPLRKEVVFRFWTEAVQWGFSRAHNLQVKHCSSGGLWRDAKSEVFSLRACRVGVTEEAPPRLLSHLNLQDSKSPEHCL